MRVGIAGIIVGVATAVSLRRENQLTMQTITLSLLMEIMTIIGLSLVELL